MRRTLGTDMQQHGTLKDTQGIMKTIFVFVSMLLLAIAVAQQDDEPRPNGVKV
jgi:hypothetical protein